MQLGTAGIPCGWARTTSTFKSDNPTARVEKNQIKKDVAKKDMLSFAHVISAALLSNVETCHAFLRSNGAVLASPPPPPQLYRLVQGLTIASILASDCHFAASRPAYLTGQADLPPPLWCGVCFIP